MAIAARRLDPGDPLERDAVAEHAEFVANLMVRAIEVDNAERAEMSGFDTEQ
jgi:hypothetical protein